MLRTRTQVRKQAFLGAAFSALLVTIVLLATGVWRTATSAQKRVAELHDASTTAATALSAIRADVYLTAILTRDYLLDYSWANVRLYVQQFEEIRTDLDKNFGILSKLTQDSGQKEALAKLQAEIQGYLTPTEAALDWTHEEKRDRGSGVLRQRVRRRQEIFALVGRAEALMQSNFERERQRITHADADFRRSFIWMISLTLGVGLAIAVLTLTRLLRLERQGAAAEVKLRELSAQLRTAQEVERKHLSRELHDEVGQMLTGLRMELAALARLNWSGEADVATRITHAKTTVEQTLKLVGNIAMLARPSMLDDLGLRPAILCQTKEFSRTTGVECEVSIAPEAEALPESYRTCIYRVVQEALTNCARHAAATRIQVSLKNAGGRLQLHIQDNGMGFHRAKAAKRGIGLVGMEERVRELDGRIAVKSSPGAGVQIDVELPAPKRVEARV
jgi:signal transduction histidine kinase